MKRFLALLCVAILAVTMAVGVTQAAVPGITDNQVTIGAFQDQSGAAAVVGINMRKGMEAYFNWVNAQGG
ncbi:MAG: hypothetical protein ACOYES_10235, partial [Bacillota bacterium]